MSPRLQLPGLWETAGGSAGSLECLPVMKETVLKRTQVCDSPAGLAGGLTVSPAGLGRHAGAAGPANSVGAGHPGCSAPWLTSPTKEGALAGHRYLPRFVFYEKT